jgi:hypothetical protein
MGIGAILGTAVQGYNAYQQHKTAKEAKTNVQNPISWSEATRRATDLNDATYDQSLRNTLNQLRGGQYGSISRGFFGQLPGAALEQYAAIGVEEARQNAINNTASQMYNSSQGIYANQMKTALNEQQQAGNAMTGTVQSIAGLPASFDFSGFKNNSASPVAASGNGQAYNFPGLGQSINQFPSEQSNVDPYFESFYKRLKSSGGSYTDPYGG